MIRSDIYQSRRKIPAKVKNITISFEDFMALQKVETAIYSVVINEIPLDIDVNVGPPDSRNLAVFFHGTITDRTQLPWRAGHRLVDGLNCSYIQFTDPAVYLSNDLRITWYSGSNDQPEFQKQASKIIAKFQSLLNYPELLFIGNDGGGFAALLYGCQFPLANIIVYNPHTSIRQYWNRHISLWLKEAWGLQSTNQLPPYLKLSVYDLLRVKGDVTIYYLQDMDRLHLVDYHMTPTFGNLIFDHLDVCQAHTNAKNIKHLLANAVRYCVESSKDGLPDGFKKI